MKTIVALNFQLNSNILENGSTLQQDTESVMQSHSEEIRIFEKFQLIESTDDLSASLTFNVIKNTDGSIRWIWPGHLNMPRFLDFYSLGNWKSRAFAFIANLTFRLGFGRLFKQDKLTIQGFSFTESGTSNWAIFTGTLGPNRKAILSIGEGVNARFVKFPFSSIAHKNLEKEQNALIQLKESNASRYFRFPEPIETADKDLFAQQALPIGSIRSTTLPTDLNLKQFLAWQESTISASELKLRDSNYSTNKFSPSLVKLVEQLNEWCQQHPIACVANNHGDFTPWNCKMRGNDLFIFDWEMFQEKGLPLEDLFHFIYQQAILVDRISLSEMRGRISQMLDHPIVIDFLSRHQLNALDIEMHYLQRICSYYLDLYSRQEKWHLQVNWLLDTWESSISLLLKIASNGLRSSVLNDFQQASSQFNYALLKFNLNSLEDLPLNSDLDLCTTRESAKGIRLFFRNHPAVAEVKRKNLTKMHQLEVILHDGSRIDLDLIFQFRRKWIDYLDAAQVLNTKVVWPNGLSLASNEMNALYVQRFYALNNSEVPDKHKHWLLQNEMSFSIEQVGRNIQNLNANRGINLFKNRIDYLREMLMSMKQDKGFLITFSGVDGAGKSTIIDEIRSELEKTHRRRVVVIRHRPSLLPIISAWKYGKKGAEERSVSTLPRQGQNSSKLSSLVRFAYYLSDYVFGQWWIHFRYVRKGVVVLYDRYYFDFINDSRRSNIALKPAFTERFYRLVRKPEFNFFLWAPPEVILRRKKELDHQTITSLTTQYTELFTRLQKRDSSSVYRCIENLNIGETVDLIMRNVTKKLHESPVYKNRSTEKP